MVREMIGSRMVTTTALDYSRRSCPTWFEFRRTHRMNSVVTSTEGMEITSNHSYFKQTNKYHYCMVRNYFYSWGPKFSRLEHQLMYCHLVFQDWHIPLTVTMLDDTTVTLSHRIHKNIIKSSKIPHYTVTSLTHCCSCISDVIGPAHWFQKPWLRSPEKWATGYFEWTQVANSGKKITKLQIAD